jgi:hypothetical protein
LSFPIHGSPQRRPTGRIPFYWVGLITHHVH